MTVLPTGQHPHSALKEKKRAKEERPKKPKVIQNARTNLRRY
jgi:hypothetical protein